jgi:hypothetical protein
VRRAPPDLDPDLHRHGLSFQPLGEYQHRVLIHVDTDPGGAKNLLCNRMAYVAVSRSAYDAQIFTNDHEKLGAALEHDISHRSAHAPEMKPEQKQE